MIILFLTVFIVGKAQVLDTISLQEFKGLKHKQIKALYTADEEALNIIKKSHTRKINAYVFFGLSVPFAVTLNPFIWIPLTPAVIKLSNNTKQSLYNKLLYYERVKYNKDTIKMVIPIDTNSYLYKYTKYEFDMTFEQFKALGHEKQKALFNINDTTQFIFDYSNTFKNNTELSYVGSTLLFTFSTYVFFEGTMAYLAKGDMYFIPVTILLGAGTIFTSLGIYVWPNKEYRKKMDNQRILFNYLQQYYLSHKVYPEVAKYIKSKRERYKPKPLIN